VFRRYRVAEVTPESSTVCSFELVPVHRALPAHAAGQFVSVRSGTLVRSYSLSSADRVRISVKREPGGRMSEHLHTALDVGATVEVAGPAGAFVLSGHRTRPVVLVSAGIGTTPVLAMLHALAGASSRREVWWVHGARNGREHAFRAEVRQLVERLPNGFSHVRYSRPDPRDVPGRDYDAPGRLTADALLDLPLPLDADFRLCGTPDFVDALTTALRAAGAQHIGSESFAPSLKGSDPCRFATVGFTRSGVTARWEPGHGSLLELAEANGVPATSGCRAGACQTCRAPVLEGTVRHHDSAQAPPGSALLCCAVPDGDVLIDA
jgi:ferredoxin-NADP reductase